MQFKPLIGIGQVFFICEVYDMILSYKENILNSLGHLE